MPLVWELEPDIAKGGGGEETKGGMLGYMAGSGAIFHQNG